MSRPAERLTYHEGASSLLMERAVRLLEEPEHSRRGRRIRHPGRSYTRREMQQASGSWFQARHGLLGTGLVLMVASLCFWPRGLSPQMTQLAGRPTTLLWFLIRQSDVNVRVGFGLLGLGVLLLGASWVAERLK